MPDWETVKSALPVEKTPEQSRQRRKLWEQFNVTNSKYLAMFEVDAGIQKVLQCEELFDAKPAVRRAYAYAREVNPKGPRDKLEFCEFRLLLVYLKGLFEVYRLFSELDGSRDMVLSLEELEAAGPRLAAAGISVPNPAALWRTLKGGNDDVDFGEFADWATRQGLAGPELLEAVEQDDEELASKLKATLRGWNRCSDGLVAAEDMRALLRKLHPSCAEPALEELLEAGTASGGRVSVDALIDSIVLTPRA